MIAAESSGAETLVPETDGLHPAAGEAAVGSVVERWGGSTSWSTTSGSAARPAPRSRSMRRDRLGGLIQEYARAA